jgi:competence protein ComEA
VDPTPPPWRVFDTPSSAQAADAATQPPTARPDGRLRLPPQAGVVAAVGGAIVLGGLAVLVAISSVSSGTALDDASAPDGSPRSAEIGGEIVVDVAGAVARPGVYHLATGSRVGDAIAAAGGFGPRVAADRVDAELNLAALVKDGDRILVPSRDSASPGSSPGPGGGAGAGSGTTLIDLNHATAEQLDSLPGIGPVTADKIIAARTKAPFVSVDDLRTRSLVGQKVFDAIRALITVT